MNAPFNGVVFRLALGSECTDERNGLMWVFRVLSVWVMCSLGALGALGVRAAQAEAWPLNTRMIMSGHSLMDPIPPVLSALVAAAGGRGAVIDRSSIPGSPMDWRWEHEAWPIDARQNIADYELLVLTERVPLLNTMGFHNSPSEALRWANHAWAHGAATILYATWVNRDTGPGFDDRTAETHLPFRARLEVENDRWIEIQTYVNANRAADMPPMAMIPGPEIWMAVYDEIAAGTAPIHDIDALFLDNIHVNDDGAYLMALAHYAVIYGADPRDLPLGLGRVPVPGPEVARWMQEIVWRVTR